MLKNLFIQTKTTPNPNFLKFIPTGQTVLKEGTIDFVAAKYATISPLARKLFALDGINRVFYGKDYISISKSEKSEWESLKPQIFALIMDQFTSKQPLIIDEVSDENQVKDSDSETVQLIKEILNTRIRPTVQDDGGDIVYNSFDQKTGIVYLHMKGSCAGCPTSSVTLKQGIEKMLMFYITEVNGVEAQDYEGENKDISKEQNSKDQNKSKETNNNKNQPTKEKSEALKEKKN